MSPTKRVAMYVHFEVTIYGEDGKAIQQGIATVPGSMANSITPPEVLGRVEVWRTIADGEEAWCTIHRGGKLFAECDLS